jgi:hypothetical protein
MKRTAIVVLDSGQGDERAKLHIVFASAKLLSYVQTIDLANRQYSRVVLSEDGATLLLSYPQSLEIHALTPDVIKNKDAAGKNQTKFSFSLSLLKAVQFSGCFTSHPIIDVFKFDGGKIVCYNVETAAIVDPNDVTKVQVLHLPEKITSLAPGFEQGSLCYLDKAKTKVLDDIHSQLEFNKHFNRYKRPIADF